MKKVLFASTALVMTAGVASAEVTLSGSAKMGVTYNGTTTSVYSDYGLAATGTAETDSGISFKATYDVDADADEQVSMSYEGLTVTVGNGLSSAADVGGIADIGISGLGVDDLAENSAAEGAADVVVAYSFGDITASISSGSNGDDLGVGLKGSFDAFTFALGFDKDDTVDSQYVGLGYSAGAFAANVHYETNGTNDAHGIDLSYTSGDLTTTVAYADNGTTSGYGVGIAYDLGGATLQGGFADVGAGTVADLGVSFSF